MKNESLFAYFLFLVTTIIALPSDAAQHLNGATRGGRRETAAQVALKGRLGLVDRYVIAAGGSGLLIGGLGVRMVEQCQNRLYFIWMLE